MHHAGQLARGVAGDAPSLGQGHQGAFLRTHGPPVDRRTAIEPPPPLAIGLPRSARHQPASVGRASAIRRRLWLGSGASRTFQLGYRARRPRVRRHILPRGGCSSGFPQIVHYRRTVPADHWACRIENVREARFAPSAKFATLAAVEHDATRGQSRRADRQRREASYRHVRGRSGRYLSAFSAQSPEGGRGRPTVHRFAERGNKGN